MTHRRLGGGVAGEKKEKKKKKNGRHFNVRISVFEKVTRGIFKLPLCWTLSHHPRGDTGCYITSTRSDVVLLLQMKKKK